MYQHILFATDLSEETQSLLPKVKKLQEMTEATLSLIHVVEPFNPYSLQAANIMELEQKILADSALQLEAIGKKLNVPKKNQLNKLGLIKPVILETAEELNIDLIVCGSHGRHGWALLLGSTANAILHGAKCDVLTFRLKP